MNHQQAGAAALLRSRLGTLEDQGHALASPVLFAHAILGTAAPLSTCQACRETLPEQIEAELNGRPGPAFRAVRRHLDLCPDCTAVYLDLLEIALLVEEGPLPRLSLVVDLSFLDESSERMEKDV